MGPWADVPPDFGTILRRIASLRDDVAAGRASRALLERIEYALSEGYAWALRGDAWEHSEASPDRGEALRQEVAALRRELAGLRADRDRLAADRAVPSG